MALTAPACCAVLCGPPVCRYTSQVRMSDMAMRAGPGRTYRFYREQPTFAFHHGLSYTSFAVSWASVPARQQTAKALARPGALEPSPSVLC